MEKINAWALTNLADYGGPFLLFISYFGSLGIPFPITIVIIAAGAFTRLGLIDWRLAILACLVGSALADNSEYLLGHVAQKWLKRRFGERGVWNKAQAILNRQGGWAILLTRFWLTSLAPAINIIAGGRYSYRRFLLLDLAGQFLWVMLYGGLGYLFALQWEWVSQLVSIFSWTSIVLLILVASSIFVVKRRKSATPRPR
jgi:membrane protein DedA with SNARE-associated domain